MLGRKNYTSEEITTGRNAIAHQLAAHDVIRERGGASKTSLAAFDHEYFNALVLVLDRYFVHRLSGPNHEGKDGNPLNEVRIICDSLISHGGELRDDKQIKLAPEKSVLGYAVGDEIHLDREQFERLSTAFFAELEKRFG